MNAKISRKLAEETVMPRVSMTPRQSPPSAEKRISVNPPSTEEENAFMPNDPPMVACSV